MAVRIRFVATVLCVFLFATAGVNANDVQRHILDAGINLGWAEAVIESQGVTAANVEYLEGCMTRAAAHIEAMKSLIGPPYTSIDFAPLQKDILEWSGKTAGLGSAGQANYVKNLFGRFTQLLSVWLDGRTNSLVDGVNCDVSFAAVGYHFGRANIAAIYSETADLRYRIQDMQTAINTGLGQVSRKLCGFGAEGDWKAVTIFTTGPSPETFAASLGQIQAIALGATGALAGNTPPNPVDSGSTPTMALWNGRWRNFGDVGLGPMALHVRGNRITGEIFAGRPEKQVGVIEATFIDEKTVTGTWTLWNPTRGGTFEWTLTNTDPRHTGFQGWQIRRNNYPAELHNHKFYWAGSRDQTTAGR